MADWTKSMQQTFEYYVVDPGTWRNKSLLSNVLTCSINRDSTAETLGSSTIDIEEALAECYVRPYLVAVQNGVTEKHPLGTVLVQTPSQSFDGKSQTVSLDAYTPLLELKETQPPIGYTIMKGENIMDMAYKLASEHMRGPVVKASSTKTLDADFVANTDDTWLTFLSDLIANAKFQFGLDEMSRVLFEPIQDISALQPVTTYTNDNSSILYPEVTLDRDLYGIPNVVEVIYSKSTETYYSRVVNDDENSPISTVGRGREIVYRVTDPEFAGFPTQEEVDEYAKNLLKIKSALEYTISYTHAYNGVRIGDCVRLNYPEAGLSNVKAKVVSQTIKCELGCPVTEKATYTKKMWG